MVNPKVKLVENNIVKSAEDKRAYRGLELSNGLKVLLISDPSTDKSSAAIDVHIGKSYEIGFFRKEYIFCLWKSFREKMKSISVAVILGHMSDPEELPGLAHFCEHMLFLGTKKYPEENEYSKVCTIKKMEF